MLKSFVISVCAAAFMLSGCIVSADEKTSTAKPTPARKNVMGDGNNPLPKRSDYK